MAVSEDLGQELIYKNEPMLLSLRLIKDHFKLD
jgi:hypothetical protein